MDTKDILGMPFEEMQELKKLVAVVKELVLYTSSLVGTLETLMDDVDELHRIPPDFWAGLELVEKALDTALLECLDRVWEMEKRL
ncbi:MAG: hypothetical protein ACPLQO_11545 [Desulfotomaculales bacterium]